MRAHGETKAGEDYSGFCFFLLVCFLRTITVKWISSHYLDFQQPLALCSIQAEESKAAGAEQTSPGRSESCTGVNCSRSARPDLIEKGLSSSSHNQQSSQQLATLSTRMKMFAVCINPFSADSAHNWRIPSLFSFPQVFFSPLSCGSSLQFVFRALLKEYRLSIKVSVKRV